MSEAEINNQFVTFKIEDELYAINVFKTREILELPDITRVPGMPEMIIGVINLRGEVVPVLDLKSKFGNGKTEFQRDTAIIITEILSGEEVIPIGIVVDAVREVVTLEADNMEPPPKIGAFIDNSYIVGIEKLKDDLIIILKLDQILSDEDLCLLDKKE